MNETTTGRFRFGGFEFDADDVVLRRAGRRVRLAPQPARLLGVLLDDAGRLVRREALVQILWGDETVVDFDAGINAAVRQIRAALRDDPAAPRFIETVPRLGYRFVAPVERLPGDREVGTTPPARAPLAPARSPRISAASATRGASRWSSTVGPLTLLVLIAAAVPALRGFVLGDLYGASATKPPQRQVDRDGPTVAPLAVDATFKGRYILENGGADRWIRAESQFRRALQIDPTYTPARIGLARALTGQGVADEHGLLDSHREACRLVERSLQEDPAAAEALALRAHCRMRGEWDAAGALADLRAAVSLEPRAAWWTELAFIQAAVGDSAGAVDSIDEAQRLDPLSEHLPLEAAWVYFYAGRYAEAVEQAERSLELIPEQFSAHLCLAESHDALGRSEASRRHAIEMTRLFGAGPEVLQAARGSAVATEESNLTDWWVDAGNWRSIPFYSRGVVLAQMQRPVQAVEAIAEAVRRHEWQAMMLAVDPRLDSLRADARFRATVASLHGLQAPDLQR